MRGFSSTAPWFVTGVAGGSEKEFDGADGRAQGKGMIARLPGIDDRDAAAELLGAEIRILRSALPKPKRGEYYWIDLEGLSVSSVEGVELGRVSHLFATGANDVLVVRDGDRERLIPYVMGAVRARGRSGRRPHRGRLGSRILGRGKGTKKLPG